MTTKPFDPTKPVQTRDGRPARIICTDRKNDYYPIVALIENTGIESFGVFTKEGQITHKPQVEDRWDLVNVPEITHKYLNVYEGLSAYKQDTLEAAKRLWSTSGWPNKYILTLKLTYEDGVLVKEEIIHHDK